MPNNLKEWLEAIKSVGLGYKSSKIRRDLKTESGVTYGESGVPMEIGKRKNATSAIHLDIWEKIVPTRRTPMSSATDAESSDLLE
jgi:hypothetical protein